MAGDLDIRESVVIEGVTMGARAAPGAASNVAADARVIHRYGRVSIVAQPEAAAAARSPMPTPPLDALDGLDRIERLGLDGLWLRESPTYRLAKRDRPRAGEEWNMTNCTSEAPVARSLARSVGAQSAGPTSSYLEGSVAVGIIIVQGPDANLTFSDAEVVKVVAEVQNGLGYLATANPLAGISFAYDIQNINLGVPPDPSAADREALWRDPAMSAIGFSPDFNGVRDYVEDIRSRFGTRWTYCGFFTRYPLNHFAYASIGGPRLVMDYANDGWGPDNIDRVFAHETGHIFGCPDEYGSSGCNCGGGWGRFGVVNGNCENCAGGGGVPCLMKGNTFNVCGYTPSHFGWAPQKVVHNFGYDVGGWRVERHPRVLADTNGDGRADIVGFGNAGAWISRAQSDGKFETPRLAVANFGYTAGGWRVEQHPRFLADTNGDGRADIVGFGNAGVYVSRSQSDGSYTAPQLVVASFGFTAGGWQVDRHPRFLADVTGDGRADIVGFGNAGVWVSLAQSDGSYTAPQLAVGGFGYNAGGWRVENHPRFLADTTGDGRADVVGFGNDGVWVARSLGDGTFDTPGLVITNFGYNAGGWRVEKHPRILADTTGDGRADVIGFGNAGAWLSRM